MVEEEKFIGAEEHHGGYNEKLSFRGILLEHIRRIFRLSAVEFRGGYNQQKVREVGGKQLIENVYIPDTREQYINAIDCLHDMSSHLFDDQMKSDDKGLKSILNLFFNKYTLKKDEKTVWINKKKYIERRLEIKRMLLRRLIAFLARDHQLTSESIEE